MNRRGVLYDVGRVLWLNWRPVFDRQTVRREPQIIVLPRGRRLLCPPGRIHLSRSATRMRV
jgi:hypothetical protein